MRILIALVLLLATAHPTLAVYVSRTCGLDLNFNGTVGEASGDCNKVCAGTAASSTPNLDGAGATDVQVFVDCGAGATGTGTAASPFKTFQEALNYYSVNPPAATAISAICLKGTCTEALTPMVSGAPGTSTVRSDGLVRPRYPQIWSAWDTTGATGDGDYSNETAVIRGGAVVGAVGNLPLAIDNGTNNVSNIEINGITFDNFGTEQAAAGNHGFVRMANSGFPSNWYIHDSILSNINRGVIQLDSRIVFNGHTGGGFPQNWIVENTSIPNWGAFLFRGACANSLVNTCGPLNFLNTTGTAMGPTPLATPNCCSAVTVAKPWGPWTDVHLVDSSFDTNASAWGPAINSCSATAGGGQACGTANTTPTFAIAWSQGVQNSGALRTDFLNWKQCLQWQPAQVNFYNGRNMTGLTFDRSRCLDSYGWQARGALDETFVVGTNDLCTCSNAIATTCTVDSACGAGNTCNCPVVNDASVTNSLFATTGDCQSFARLDLGAQAGATPSGTITIAGNTIKCRPIRGDFPMVHIGNINNATELPVHNQTFVVENNDFDGFTNTTQGGACFDYIPTALTWDGNYWKHGLSDVAFSTTPGGKNVGGGCTAVLTFAQFIAAVQATGGANATFESHVKTSADGTPSYLNTATFDYHLSNDTALVNTGRDISGITAHDYDNDTRCTGAACDIGYDESPVLTTTTAIATTSTSTSTTSTSTSTSSSSSTILGATTSTSTSTSTTIPPAARGGGILPAGS